MYIQMMYHTHMAKQSRSGSRLGAKGDAAVGGEQGFARGGISRRPTRLRSAAAEALANSPGLLARRLERRLTAAYDAALQPIGLSLAHLDLMATVATAADDTIGALAERMGLDASTLSRTLEGLARRGLVEIVAVEADRRRRAVWLTEAGARLLADALDRASRVTQALPTRCDPDVLAGMVQVLDEDTHGRR